MFRNLLINLALLSLSMILVLVAGDFMVRYLRPEFVEHFAYDSTYIHKYYPDVNKAVERTAMDGGEKIRLTTNRFGLRDEDFPIAKTGRRVMVYGDSFIASELSELDNTYPKQLQQMLNETSGKPIQVINAGVAGYGVDQVSLRLDEDVDRYDPDLVIISLFAGNDFGDNVRNKLFTLDDEGSAVYRQFALKKYKVFKWKLRRLFPSMNFYKRAVYFRILRAVSPPLVESDYLGGVFEERIAEYDSYAGGSRLVTNIFRDQYDLDMLLEPDSERSLFKRALMEGVIDRIVDTLESRGVEYFFVVVPARYEIVPAFLTDRLNDDQKVDTDIDFLSSTAAQVLEKCGVDYISFLSPFKETNRGNSYFWKFDDHWNDNGQKYAARLTVKKIDQEGYF